MSKASDNPETEGDDTPASLDQISFLRDYSELDDAELAKLGKEDAANLIEELREEQQREADATVPRGLGIGCTKSLVIVLLIAAIAAVLWLRNNRNEDGSFKLPKSIEDLIGREAWTGTAPVANEDSEPSPTDNESPGPAAAPAKQPEPKAEPPAPPAPVWPPKTLPAACRATKPLGLLAEDGTMVNIAAGQALHVIASPKPNVWKFQYRGKVLIGSGSRVRGKLSVIEK